MKHLPHDANRYRWHVLRYLRSCTYPASIGELADAIGPRVGVRPSLVETTIRERDLPVLVDYGAVEYDPESGLACLSDGEKTFTDRIRRAIDAGAISHLKPPRLDWVQEPRANPALPSIE